MNLYPLLPLLGVALVIGIFLITLPKKRKLGWIIFWVAVILTILVLAGPWLVYLVGRESSSLHLAKMAAVDYQPAPRNQEWAKETYWTIIILGILVSGLSITVQFTKKHRLLKGLAFIPMIAGFLTIILGVAGLLANSL